MLTVEQSLIGDIYKLMDKPEFSSFLEVLKVSLEEANHLKIMTDKNMNKMVSGKLCDLLKVGLFEMVDALQLPTGHEKRMLDALEKGKHLAYFGPAELREAFANYFLVLIYAAYEVGVLPIDQIIAFEKNPSASALVLILKGLSEFGNLIKAEKELRKQNLSKTQDTKEIRE